MNEGFLHKGGLWDDVTKFEASPETEAEGCGGGFPCQAWQSLQPFRVFNYFLFLAVDVGVAVILLYCFSPGPVSPLV